MSGCTNDFLVEIKPKLKPESIFIKCDKIVTKLFFHLKRSHLKE